MSVLFKVVVDFQTSYGRVFVFCKDDPRVKTLDVGDIITTANGCWKLTGYEAAGWLMRIKDKKEKENYRAFVVHKMGC